MDFQKLYARIRDIDQGKETLNESVVECGAMPAPVTPPAAPPVTMSVNFNAQGIDHIKELLGLMQASEGPLAAGPVDKAMPMPTPGMPAGLPAPKDDLGDIAKLAGLAPKPAIADANPEKEAEGDDLGNLEADIAGMNDAGADAESPEAGAEGGEEAEAGTGEMMQDIADEIKDMADELADENGDEEEEEETDEGAYDASTTPNPEYQDTNYMIKDLAGGLNKEKKMFKHSYKQADNPMAMEGLEELQALLAEEYRKLKSR